MLTADQIHDEHDAGRQLLKKVAEGDERAFGLLFKTHAQKLGHYLYRMCESKEVTEEIIQDVFTIVWQKRQVLADIGNLDNYLFILSKHRVLNHLRQLAAERCRQLEWSSQQEEAYDEIKDLPGLEKASLLLDEAVKKLPPQQRLVYTLSREEQLKYEEIAQRLGLTKETVKTHMKLALSFLRSNLKATIEQALCYVLAAVHFFF
jgi:RNA polymerase sigma-70 factor (ECF subfamily)